MVNGAWVSLGSTEDPTYGRPVLEYRSEGKDYLWIRFYDGTQTAADAGLVSTFQATTIAPTPAAMVGRGIAYAVIWARFNPKVHNGLPECLFELDGARLYDPRRDSRSAGPARSAGTTRRAGRRSAIRPTTTRSCRSTISGSGCAIRSPMRPSGAGAATSCRATSRRASWFAAMNECDALASGDGGDEPQYRAGLELLLTEDAEPADAAEELLKACQGQIAFVAGQWLIKAGPTTASVWAFSDDDVIVTSPEDFDPFPGLDGVFNAVTATYPEPEDGWQPKDAPKRVSLELPGRGRRPAAGGSAAVPGGAVPVPGAAADEVGARGSAPLPPAHAGAAARGPGAGAARRGRMDERAQRLRRQAVPDRPDRGSAQRLRRRLPARGRSRRLRLRRRRPLADLGRLHRPAAAAALAEELLRHRRLDPRRRWHRPASRRSSSTGTRTSAPAACAGNTGWRARPRPSRRSAGPTTATRTSISTGSRSSRASRSR